MFLNENILVSTKSIKIGLVKTKICSCVLRNNNEDSFNYNHDMFTSINFLKTPGCFFYRKKTTNFGFKDTLSTTNKK